MAGPRAEFIDVLCQRYPGTRPSDLWDDLDPVDALILDASMAYKFHLRDFDLVNLQLHDIKDIIQQGFTAMGGKKPKQQAPPPAIARPDNYKEDDDVPYLSQLVATASTGQGTIVIE